jgi:aldehyde oxidoreductase
MIRQAIHFTLNGKRTEIFVDPLRRLADVLREDLDLIGTKIGCNAGHCGACTILLDGHQACSCMISVAQATGRDVVTVEGLMEDGQDGARRLSKLQRAFHDHGATQCGFCTPGMLIAAQDLLNRNEAPAEQDVLDALAGVLCRCTGYRKIIDAVLSVGHTDTARVQRECSGDIVGSRIPKVDGLDKLMGVARYGADFWPRDSLVLRAIRSPHHHAHFAFGDFASLHAAHPGLVKVLTAADILGQMLLAFMRPGKISRFLPTAMSDIGVRRSAPLLAMRRRLP